MPFRASEKDCCFSLGRGRWRLSVSLGELDLNNFNDFSDFLGLHFESVWHSFLVVEDLKLDAILVFNILVVQCRERGFRQFVNHRIWPNPVICEGRLSRLEEDGTFKGRGRRHFHGSGGSTFPEDGTFTARGTVKRALKTAPRRF